MSWFDTTGFASFAKSALNTAQKTIDKALDIKEDFPDASSVSSPAPLKPEVDTFFESFGLGAKSIPPLSSAQTSIPPLIENVHPAGPSGSGAQNSGFWTDTWGSFFDTKAAPPELQKGPITTEAEITTLSPKKSSMSKEDRPAVSSQPQRAGLFPGGVKPLEQAKQPSQTQDSAVSSTEENKSTGIAGDSADPPASICDTTESESVSNELSSPQATIPLQKSKESDLADSNNSGSTTSCDTLENVANTELESFPDVGTIETSEKVNRDDSLVSIRDNMYDSSAQRHFDAEDTSSEMKDSAKDQSIVKSSDQIVESTVNKSTVSLNNEEVMVLECSESVTNLSDSYINLESSILEKSAFTGVPSFLEPESSPSHNSLLRSCTPQSDMSQENDSKGFSDSFHILNDSVMQHESVWVMDMVDSTTPSSSDDRQSRNGDTGSSSSKDDCEMDIKDCDTSSNSRSQELTSSFVKCSLEDLVFVGHRGQSPLSTTTSERSDLTKLESEQNTSGDENETTTSSDIEVLSPPNGENNDRTAFPLKHMWVPHSLSIRGSESPVSDCSKDGPATHAKEAEGFSEEGKKSGIFYFKSDKDSKLRRYEGFDIDKIFQQQEELQALLEAREKKIMELSTENVKLHENEEKLQNQVSATELSLVRESQSMSSVTKDLTQRLAQIENMAQKASKERDMFRQQLEEAQHEVVQRITLNQMEEAVKEKNQQIKELMEEGQKLSKKELQHLTIIKKLRAKEEETEHNAKSLREKLEETTKEVDRLRRSLGAKDEQEKTHIEAIRQLTNTVNKDEKEIALLKSNLEDSSEKESTSKKSLEGIHKELTDLRKSSAEKDKEIKELKLSVEMSAKEKLREGLDQANKEANREKEMLLIQMEDLRGSLKRCEEESNLRENSLREDIARLQLSLQVSESRNEELTKNISNSSRPLVRQMETLQASYNTQISSWEKIEKSLSDRLNDYQNQLSVCTAKEKLACEKYQEVSSKLVKLELQNNVLLQEKVQLSSNLEVSNSKLAILEDSKNRNVSSMDSLKQGLTLELNKTKDEKEKIAKELENCIELLKEERNMNHNLQEELKIKDNKLHLLGNNSASPSPSASLRSSVESINNWAQEESQDRRISTQLSSYRLSVYDSLTRTGCTTSVLESLQSQLKQREGEISQLQCEISKLEKERENIAQELVEVTSQNEELAEKLEKLKNFEKLHKDLSQKYNALLQMYNEKMDEHEALQNDLADVKSAYRRQIEELLQNQ